MKTKKRFLSILLSLVMVLGIMPGMTLTAYANLTIGIEPSGGGTVTQVPFGNSDNVFDCTATANPGYKFDKWTYTKNGVNNYNNSFCGGVWWSDGGVTR